MHVLRVQLKGGGREEQLSLAEVWEGGFGNLFQVKIKFHRFTMVLNFDFAKEPPPIPFGAAADLSAKVLIFKVIVSGNGYGEISFHFILPNYYACQNAFTSV